MENIKIETESVKKEKVEENPYAYLDRDFSSENFKVEIKNLPKFYGIHEFRKLLNTKLKLNASKVKAVGKNSPYAFVCFRNEEGRENALKVLSDFKWKGKKLQAIKAKAAPDPLVKKRKLDAEEEKGKKIKKDDRPQEERLKSSTVPYWNVDYQEQLKLKQTDIKNVLKRLSNDISHHNPELREWINMQKSLHDGLPCKLENIRYSVQTEGYRNKCEFSVGIDEETNLPTVGFRIGSYVNGTTAVGPIDGLVHIPESMKVAVTAFQDFVRKSKLKPFSPEFQKGHFRQLMARSARAQLMLVIGIHPQDLTEEEIVKFKKELVEYFTRGDGKKSQVTSLYYQKLVKKNYSGESFSAEHLYGETHIYETILGLKFKVSPEAFFQINTKGAEILYSTAIELAEATDQSTVLDVCCGTGTIGLCFAHKCGQVLGLEVIPQAIVDANENAKNNNIDKAEFFTGKAEEILGTVCFKAKNDDVIAVVDPPRAGLHQRALLQLRKIPKINKVVYISCSPTSALKNFIDFSRPISKTVHGDFFVPTKAIAVDMFPYTKHCELLIRFERWETVSKRVVVVENENQ